MIAFADHWRRHYSDTPPLSYVLRDAFHEHWLRFHALPNSRRYPKSDSDRAAILHRACILGKETIGEDAPCWLVQLGSPELGWPADASKSWERYSLKHAANYEHDGATWPAYVGRTAFSAGRFDDLIIDIAEDRAFRTLWLADDGEVFAPYDGGFDLLLRSPEAMNALRQRYAAWLPNTASGL